MARVVVHSRFERDVRVQIQYLRTHEDVDRISGLLEDLADLKEMLGRFPEAGRELTRSGADDLRKLRVRRAPFYVWYSFDQDLDEVTLFRLFHAKQLTPDPRLP